MFEFKKIRYAGSLLRVALIACLAVLMTAKLEAAVVVYAGPDGRPSSFTNLDVDGTFYDGVIIYNTTFLDTYGSTSSPSPIPPLWGDNTLALAVQLALVASLNADGNQPNDTNVTIYLPTENKRTNLFLDGFYGYFITQRAPIPGFSSGVPYTARDPRDLNAQAGIGNDSTGILTSLTPSATVPEPSSIALLSIGACFAIGFRRR